MDKNFYNINKYELRKIIIKVYKQLKIGRLSDISSELLADAILDNIDIYLKLI